MAARPPTYPAWVTYLVEGKRIPYKSHWIKPSHPLALADEAKSYRQNLREPECITEMSLMMACWKKNEFSDIPCAQEIQKFITCAANAEAKYKETKQQEHMGQSANLNLKQINKLLRRFPNIKYYY